MYKFTLKGQRNRYKILCINYIIHTSTGISVNVLTACKREDYSVKDPAGPASSRTLLSGTES